MAGRVRVWHPSIDQIAVAFFRRAARWRSIGVRPYYLLTQWENNVLTMTVDIDDAEARCVVRTPRADYDGVHVLVGVDRTGSWHRR